MAEERRSCVCSQFEQRAGSLLFLYDLSLVSSSTPVTVMAIHRLLTFKSLFPAWFSFLSSRFTHLTVRWTSLQRSSTVSSYITGSKLNLTISTLTSPAPPCLLLLYPHHRVWHILYLFLAGMHISTQSTSLVFIYLFLNPSASHYALCHSLMYYLPASIPFSTHPKEKKFSKIESVDVTPLSKNPSTLPSPQT